MPNCKQCQSSFEILPADREFYKMMQVPEPTFCPMCRMQRRLSYRQERFLKHRKCDLTGKQIISVYPAGTPWPVYANEAWWSDRWDPLSFGRDFDFSRPFFEQFFELRDTVPRLALIQQHPMENSDYCNAAGHCRNCYLCFSSDGNEDCYYSSWINTSKNSMDCKSILRCELCYDCVQCRDGYELKYSQNCTNCKNSSFLRNCVGCRDCFGCSNLIDKQYFVFNKPYSKKEYDSFMKQVDMSRYSTVSKIKEKIDSELNDLIVKEYEGVNNQNSVGDYMSNCKNAFICFDVDDSEDLRYCQGLNKAKSSMDHSHWGESTERCYECQAVGYNHFNIRFCNLCWTDCADLTYCDHSFASKNCFGCVGLKKNEYCILNKQYTKAEYERLAPAIIEHMKKTGEWGEFFPAKHSIFGYNETMAHEEIPLTQDQALKQGFRWLEESKEENLYKGPRYEIPDSIGDVSDDILNKILVSATSGKPYKIIPQELKFYRENNIPIPRLTPDERHWERLKKRNPRVLYDRTCVKCGKAIRITYAPGRPEIVYCENCYLKTVY